MPYGSLVPTADAKPSTRVMESLITAGTRTPEASWTRKALDGSRFELVHVENTMKEMLDAGSRYNNLEKALGEGVVFILGKDISES
ncbi:hypothetical protein H2202_004459 [Exophiala xenobiotica]|nr:hypothetical protein H2202_004459 [Exophiala xenobiotica]